MTNSVAVDQATPTGELGEHGLLGDTRTAALSSPTGSINWLCFPRFDGRPVFGSLIGGPESGSFTITPSRPPGSTQRRYRGRSATVETEWSFDDNAVVLTEGMVSDVAGSGLPEMVLLRRVEAHGNSAQVRVLFDPRFGWSRRRPRCAVHAGSVVVTDQGDALALTTDAPALFPPGVPVELVVEPGRPVTFVLSGTSRGPATLVPPDVAWSALVEDELGWRRWAEDLADGVPFEGAVVRSLLTLRLLTHSPSGAPVAAPTTSLPEKIGGTRNWDYRYAWPRDASMGISAFLGVGRSDEALRFLTWLLHASRLHRPKLPPLLTLLGKPVRFESEIADWPGFADSRPVRVGNAAAEQHQLDVYGWALDAAHRLARHRGRLDSATWRATSAFADYVADNWHLPDAGVWEVRGERQHFVHSKLMAWVALDRAVRLARTNRVRATRMSRWAAARDAVRAVIVERGYDERRHSYVRSFGSNDLDAALLLLPVLGFEPPESQRVRATVDAIASELTVGGSYVRRYQAGSDGIAGAEGAFLPCSFWLVQALAVTDRAARAEELMGELVDLGGQLGLFAEEVDVDTGRQLGNYPQAFTHAALVQAALALRGAKQAGAGAKARSRT